MRDNVFVGGQEKQQQNQQHHHQQQHQKADRVIKKSYVRFDDYLNMSDENMLRSRKRIMNHLYSESDNLPTEVPVMDGKLSSVEVNSQTGISKLSSSETASIQAPTKTVPNPASSTKTSGKSYLRSQYEKRQQRQLELMEKQESIKEENAPSGASSKSNSGSQNSDRMSDNEQDLIAKSHALSKRRFFERLERRESLNFRAAPANSSYNGSDANNLKNNATCPEVIAANFGQSKNIDFYNLGCEILADKVSKAELVVASEERTQNLNNNNNNNNNNINSQLTSKSDLSVQQKHENKRKMKRPSPIVLVESEQQVGQHEKQQEFSNANEDELDKMIIKSNHPIKEECGSSCSSSGFGASNSVTSSSSSNRFVVACGSLIDEEKEKEKVRLLAASFERELAKDLPLKGRPTSKVCSVTPLTMLKMMVSKAHDIKKRQDQLEGSEQNKRDSDSEVGLIELLEVARNQPARIKSDTISMENCAPLAREESVPEVSDSDLKADCNSNKNPFDLPDQVYSTTTITNNASAAAEKKCSTRMIRKRDSRSSILVENQSYANIWNGAGKYNSLPRDASIVFEPDRSVFSCSQVVGERDETTKEDERIYANLSCSGNKRNSNNLLPSYKAEYAIVRSVRECNDEDSKEGAIGDPSIAFLGINRNESQSEAGIVSSRTKSKFDKWLNKTAPSRFSGRQSYSSGSINSAGFSMLPPAVDTQKCASANTKPYSSMSIIVPNNEEKERERVHKSATLTSARSKARSGSSSNLLKRFGSLVSKAFISKLPVKSEKQHPHNVQCGSISGLENLEESGKIVDLIREASFVEEQQKEENDNKLPESVVIEQIEAASSACLLDEADLVIMPTNHVNKPELMRSQREGGTGRSHQLNNDSLSRAATSRRNQCIRDSVHYTTDLTSCSSSTSMRILEESGCDLTDEEFDSLMSNRSTNDHQVKKQEDEAKQAHQNNNSKSKETTKLCQQLQKGKTSSSALQLSMRRTQKKKILTTRIVDIDCVSPKQQKAADEIRSLSKSSFRVVSSGSKCKQSPKADSLTLRKLDSSSQEEKVLQEVESRDLTNSSKVVSIDKKNYTSLKANRINDHSDKTVVLNYQPRHSSLGFSSMMSNSHASNSSSISLSDHQDRSGKYSKYLSLLRKRKGVNANTLSSPHKGETKRGLSHSDEEEDRERSMYSELAPFAAGYSPLSSSISEEENLNNKGVANDQEGACSVEFQSLNLYQSLLNSYKNKRHARRHHHHHHHRRHHSHRTCQSSACTKEQKCAKSCRHSPRSSVVSSNLPNDSCRSSRGSSAKHVGGVWGQLIKINKSDGSQVIELQREPGKSWGFFVARGSINNVKGIFISRMHDSNTSESLAGLLTIGDRILSIDENSVGPDYDILWVNHLMRKKSKILLRVKPFKG